jgi:glutamate--cysteine ligase
LGPLFALICDNGSVFEGQPFTGGMVRAYIWDDVDPARSMAARGAFEKGYGFRDYAAYVYDAPPILLPKNGEIVYTGKVPASELFAERLMTEEEVEHCVSIMFPDVRLKNCIEIRMADSMPIEGALAYTALIKGIFYNSANLEALYKQTYDITGRDASEAKAALKKDGVKGQVYGRPASDWVAGLLETAKNGLSAAELPYLKVLECKA